ncbi:MAG TPA: hypothetical protein VJ946_00985, partial [Bacteroidales bacterium]|nr:hypothetical protein [Bacteroidales bacterium]
TVHVKGICTRNKGKDYELLKNYTTTLTFKDANHQTINTKTVKTNAYGSFSAELMIPEGLLNGRLSIRTPSGSSYIRLEEYKRPAFEVNLDDPDGNYRLESKVSFSGNAKAYTGASISDAKVKYTVFREPQYHQIWRFGYMPQQREMIAHGTTQTGEGGGFNLSFVAEPLASLPKSQNLTYRFSVEAEVTDITGETHADSKSFVVGYRTLKMNTDLSENADVSELDSIVINTQNLNGETLQTKGSLVLYRLKQPENVLIEKAWNVPEFHMDTKEAWKEMLPGYEYEDEADIENYPDKEKVYSLSFNTADKTKYPIPEMKNLPAGAYRLELRARDAFNMPVIDKEYIRIYNK